MATAASRSSALVLDRKLLRSARTWPGPAYEKKYILEETHTQFRLNQHLLSPEEINSKIFEGESRLDIGWQDKSPYPRLQNFPTGGFPEKPSRPAGKSFEVGFDTILLKMVIKLHDAIF